MGREGRARHPRGRGRSALAAGAALACAVLTALTAAGGATAQDPFCQGDLDFPTPRTGAPPLVMGIYPGGVAGQLGPPKPAKPEDAAKRQAALDLLRGDREFAVHLYVEFAGDASQDANNEKVSRELEDYMRRGYIGELVLTYRPVARRGAPDVAEFAQFARRAVRRFGPNPNFHALQVTNEVTNSISPDASDGAYPGAKDALIQGILAADDEVRRLGVDHVQVGFNWLYRMPPNTEEEFWTYLRDKGGPRFVAAVDWVGVDAYPGTFFPPAVRPDGERSSLVNAFSLLRECYLPIPKIPKAVPLHVSENGYPTSPPARSYAQQEEFLRSMVDTVSRFRKNYNVTDYRWFDLRDANSDDPDFGQQYGIMRDDYTPKPAFGAYGELVQALGAPRRARQVGEPGAPRRCLRRRARIFRGGLAGARLGRRRAAVRRRLGDPTRFTAASDRWCVRGGGQLRVSYARGRVRLALTTARGHRIRRGSRRVGPGSSRRALLAALRGERVAGRLVRSRRLAFGVTRGRVRFAAVADRRVASRTRLLRLHLRRAGALRR